MDCAKVEYRVELLVAWMDFLWVVWWVVTMADAMDVVKVDSKVDSLAVATAERTVDVKALISAAKKAVETDGLMAWYLVALKAALLVTKVEQMVGLKVEPTVA